MKDWLEILIAGLQETKTQDELQRVIFRMRDLYEVEHVVYHSMDPTGQQFAVLTYQPNWIERYIAQGYARVDPVVQSCYRRFHPVDWRRLDWSGPKPQNFLDEALDAGVGNQGLSVPIRGPDGQFALFTASARARDATWESYSREYAADLILVAHFVNQKVVELFSGPDTPPSEPLSSPEIDVLALLALGYTRAQVADNLAMTENSLLVHVESARMKLRASNTTNAIAKAIASRQVLV